LAGTINTIKIYFGKSCARIVGAVFENAFGNYF
jgi:hypothetical protein